MLEIALFTTGGTIDGADADRGMIRESSSAANWLGSQNDLIFTQREVLNKDSREISAEDRRKIIESVRACKVDRIIVTHGTFTICETGRGLKAAFGKTQRSILLVGSWMPFGESNSDAPKQMEYALRVLREGTPGVFIAMDGRLWDPDITEKKEVSPGEFRLMETDG